MNTNTGNVTMHGKTILSFIEDNQGRIQIRLDMPADVSTIHGLIGCLERTKVHLCDILNANDTEEDNPWE